MFHQIKLLCFSGCLILLAACNSTQSPNAPINTQWQAQRDWQHFDATGRLGVQINEKGSYANFDWTRENGVETIDVNTPLGNTVGQLCQDAQGVLALDANGKLYTADTPQALSEQLLGYHLPIQYLGVWANGEWVRDEPYRLTEFDQLQQLGWTISRELNDDKMTRILLLKNDKMNLRMVFSEISRNEGQPEKQGQCAARLAK